MNEGGYLEVSQPIIEKNVIARFPEVCFFALFEKNSFDMLDFRKFFGKIAMLFPERKVFESSRVVEKIFLCR